MTFPYGPGMTTMFGVDYSAAAKRNVAAFQYFYNLETAVGLGELNHLPSVMLAQYMLDVFLSRFGEQLGAGRLPVTGVVDSATDRAIRAFQRWLEMSPHAGAVPVDGVLRPVAGTLVEGPAGRYVPPVLLLNRLWTSIQPETFTNPARLAGILGDDIAYGLWESHPVRQTNPEYQVTQA